MTLTTISEYFRAINLSREITLKSHFWCFTLTLNVKNQIRLINFRIRLFYFETASVYICIKGDFFSKFSLQYSQFYGLLKISLRLCNVPELAEQLCDVTMFVARVILNVKPILSGTFTQKPHKECYTMFTTYREWKKLDFHFWPLDCDLS